MVVHAFNLSTWEVEAGRWISEFEANLVCRANFRTARAVTQRNSASERKKKHKKTNQTRLARYNGSQPHNYNGSTQESKVEALS